MDKLKQEPFTVRLHLGLNLLVQNDNLTIILKKLFRKRKEYSSLEKFT